VVFDGFVLPLDKAGTVPADGTDIKAAAAKLRPALMAPRAFA
jgi:hypothetical protein